MKAFVNVGIIQPVIDPGSAWGLTSEYDLNINLLSAERVWNEILIGLIEMLKVDGKPDIILIPELHIPISKISQIKKFSKKYNVIIIGGIDFQSNPIIRTKIRNRGIICIPDSAGFLSKALRVSSMQFGKTYFTYMERSMFSKGIVGIGPCEADPEQNMYVFESEQLGNFGVMICSDIFDLERMMLYQGRIHHLFIISLNKDLNTYFAMAESLTRMLYCNVVICNTGHYGGSMAVAPFRDVNQRIIYKYIGQQMFNTHVINIPLIKLEEAQNFDFINDENSHIPFKASPPGYRKQPNSRKVISVVKKTV
jgi:predicted amidohydrolase